MTDTSADATDEELALIDALATKIMAVMSGHNPRLSIGALQTALHAEIVGIECVDCRRWLPSI